MPRRHISARLAPLPPRRAFMDMLPSERRGANLYHSLGGSEVAMVGCGGWVVGGFWVGCVLCECGGGGGLEEEGRGLGRVGRVYRAAAMRLVGAGSDVSGETLICQRRGGEMQAAGHVCAAEGTLRHLPAEDSRSGSGRRGHSTASVDSGRLGGSLQPCVRQKGCAERRRRLEGVEMGRNLRGSLYRDSGRALIGRMQVVPATEI
mmetsp:Transcript_26180/g.65458  ORF Transcript_26180/g.65458 Transcript_26180/m.65458 type:complete len:205 (-) Transcript_26180:101-715(-)